MQSSDPSIYAAGDSAACEWGGDESGAAPHWFQMRLWSQVGDGRGWLAAVQAWGVQGGKRARPHKLPMQQWGCPSGALPLPACRSGSDSLPLAALAVHASHSTTQSNP